MGQRLLTLSRTLLEWGNAGAEGAVRDVTALLLRGPETWDAWLARHPRARNCHTFSALLDRCHAAFDDDPALAASIAAFIVRHIDDVTVPPERSVVYERLMGRAWIECGELLRQRGASAEALVAFQHAIDRFSADPVAVLGRAGARRGLALTLHQQGQSARALELLREDLPLFRDAHDIAGVMQSRFAEGTILEAASAADAIAPYADALQLAKLLGDRRATARLLLRLGHCMADLREASACFREALPILADEGMFTDITRVRWGMARLHARQGHLDEALAAYDQVVHELLGAGFPTESAMACLETVSLMVGAGRYDYAANAAAELFTYFHGQGLEREAFQALGIIRDAAQHGALTHELLQETIASLRGGAA